MDEGDDLERRENLENKLRIVRETRQAAGVGLRPACFTKNPVAHSTQRSAALRFEEKRAGDGSRCREMSVVVQRVPSAGLEVAGRVVSEIGPGLIGINESNTDADADYMYA
ncbi:hypothetical protein C4D60_Mb10t27380 [Musa balbisiana]|uniref:Uncharacterized protein n=1 Tax=Musa balbisiana TaxID=52838 RepID=A0A4S8J120_MUSBA|nr:hypothetical protein C4D60_Mb10t27380 [Musa balbisiana]